MPPVIVNLRPEPQYSLTWIVLLMLAILAGVGAVYLIPFIRGLRLFW